MAQNRLIGQYPVIGIRPVIDARRGMLKVRESLEEQTMNMARSAAKLFEEELRYSNGEPVRVVISETTIGRVAEAARCADQFKREGVDITLTVTPCWCYGSETMDMDPMTIKGVWGFNGTERPGAVSVSYTHLLRAFAFRHRHDVRGCERTGDRRTGKSAFKRVGQGGESGFHLHGPRLGVGRRSRPRHVQREGNCFESIFRGSVRGRQYSHDRSGIQ